MIRVLLKLLEILFVSLGFGYNEPVPKNSLYPRNEPKPFEFNLSPVAVVFLIVVGMILFVGIIFLFAPGVESGVFYNGSLY